MTTPEARAGHAPAIPIHPLQFLDVSCTVGPYHNPAPGLDWSPAALLAKMDALGIAQACPATLLGRDYDPQTGNHWLRERVSPSERFFPVWTAATHHTGEFPTPETLLAEMRVAGVRLLRLFLSPTAFLPRLDLPVLGELFDALDSHRVPLIVDAFGAGQLGAAELEPVLQRWPHLPLILSVRKVTQEDRWCYYLWERYAHFYLDLPGYQHHFAIERVVERFGPHRLLYGSHYPFFTPLQTMLQVIYAEIDETARRAIAGDTLRALLRESAP